MAAAPVPGWVALAEGRQAEVFLRSDGTVVKLMRDADDGPWIEREVLAIRAVTGRGITVPMVLEVIDVDGRAGLVMERIEGRDLFQLLGARPWRTFDLGRLLGRLHAAVHQHAAPIELRRHHDVIGEWIDDADLLTPSQRRAARAALDELPRGDRLAHGDHHLGNLIGDPAAPTIIDRGAATAADPVADVAQTVLMHRVAQPGPGTPGLVRALAPVGGRVLAASYLRGYREVTPVDVDAVERWVPVLAAARLVHHIDDEVPALRAIATAAFGE